MDELEIWLIRARSGDQAAFESVVRYFQDMAVGYSYALLGDHHLAEDAAQEAFINAYCDLRSLRDLAAFPGWFRRIVFKHADRLRRGKRVSAVSLSQIDNTSAARQPSSRLSDPVRYVEAVEGQNRITDAINTLPDTQREVLILFYIGNYAQQEISTFLDLPVSTVRMRLYHARQRLKKRILSTTVHQVKAR
ncbi:sigma-70 family RNA polymerase sigma factor [Chloroflexi bacterium TSY]|nr:sigma-70 family RNA polymerase sigma factor [Chloroflexi bacterium TSY]